MDNVFERLSAVNVNEHTEKKNDLTYLSWAWAWAEFKKVYPDVTYEIWRNEQGMPYIFDPNLGYMVFTSVTVGDLTHSMWLPVMDNKNNAMKNVKYKVTKGRYSTDVEPATMFDVNSAIMRCLTKNLAMFGLGLYIYAGEDLPEDQSDEETVSTSDSKPSIARKKASTGSALNGADGEQVAYWRAQIEAYANAHKMTVDEICHDYGIGKQSDAKKLEAVYKDLTSESTADSKPSTDMPDFTEIDEAVPF